LTLSDQSVTLQAPHDADRAAFDRAAGWLETELPEAFVLTAALLPPPEAEGQADAARPEFRVVVAPDGRVTLTGRLPDSRFRQVVGAYARARFGSQAVTIETRLDPDLAPGWTQRVLAGLAGLAEVQHGWLALGPDRMEIEGVSGQADAAQRIGQLVAARLGGADGLAVRVTYDARYDPAEQEPTPERCEGWVREAQGARKITFAPGSARLDDDSAAVLDAIAEVLRRCGELALEVSGHTDSQGRAETNQALSQARAEAVVAALGARAVLTAGMVARGYGADRPVGDNATEEGREANRRIEFALILPVADLDTLTEEGRAELESRMIIAPREVTEGQTRPEPRPAPGGD
jgi:OOP family OmpA-OmpF porin